MSFLIDGTTELPENGDTGWGTVLNAAINSIDNRFVWVSSEAVAKKVAASGITGTTLASNVVTSSLTTVGTLGSLGVSGNVTIGGDLTVNGNTVTLNTATLSVEDNIVILNSGVTGSPALDAGIEVERGTSTNVVIRWNETTDKWQFTNDGTTYLSINDVADLTGTTLPATITGSSLTSVGTVSSGTWNGTAIAGQYGGTGVANTGKTITVSGNTTIGSSTHTVAFTTSGNTSVALPTTGTLATLSGSESLTNKKLGSLTTNGFVTTSGSDGTLSVTGSTGSGSVVLSGSPSISSSITTSTSTFSLVNTVASTVNFAGEASTLNIGGTTGTTTVRNGLTVTGPTILGPAVITQQSANYVLALGDAGEVVEMTNSTDATVTVPSDLAINYPVGTQITVVRNGTGKVQFVPSSGVSILSDASKQYISTQYSAATLIKRASNEWYLFGNLAAS